MGKAKMYGAKSSYIPNAKADMRYRQKLFQHGCEVAERNTTNPRYARRLEKEIKRCKRKQATEEVQHVHS